MNKTTDYAPQIRPMSLERVDFHDGMILTADDLEAERRYLLDRSRMINRGVYGCGIVCGLGVEKAPEDAKQTRFICVHPGIAIDCHGDPLELCRPVKLDLDPDPCKCPPGHVCIVIRRRDGKPDGSDPCGCAPSPEDGSRRVREEVEIRVIDDPTNGDIGDLCWNPPPRRDDDSAQGKNYPGPLPEAPQDRPGDDPCACLKACEPCDGCKEGWILLACIDLDSPKDDDKIPAPDRDRWTITEIDESGRKYIKPIHCHCLPERRRRRDDEPRDGYEKPATKPKPRPRPKPKPRR